MQPKDPSQHVFRESLEEHRDGYSVSYQPADARCAIAMINLFYAEVPRDRNLVARAMEAELEHWLERFPVPVKVTAYNARKRMIRISPNTSECQMMGYVRLLDETIVRRWGLMEDFEIPAETCHPDHLEEAYAKIPFRVRDEIREMERLAFRVKLKGVALTLGLMLLFPLFLQAILHWGRDLVVYLTVASFLMGAYKGAGVIGLRRPSRFERRKAERLGKREHYFFHCERNPASFARLEKENFKREVNRETKKAKQILEDLSKRSGRERTSWMAVPRLFRAKSC